MMDWIEADPLPAACLNCQKEDCYNCDTAGERWQLSREDEQRVRRKQLTKAIERLQRKIDAIDMELLPFTAEQSAALNGNIEMTYDLFWQCLQVCFDNDNMRMYRRIWGDYPNLTLNIKKKSIPFGMLLRFIYIVLVLIDLNYHSLKLYNCFSLLTP